VPDGTVRNAFSQKNQVFHPHPQQSPLARYSESREGAIQKNV